MVKHHALLVLAIASSGCSAKQPPRAGTADSPVNQAILIKLQGYQGCLDHSQRVFQIADGYTAQFGATPPTPATEVPLQASVDPETCLDNIDAARVMPPSMPEVEAAADRFAKAIGSVYALTTASRDHFDRASKTYAPAQGVALHPQLLSAFREFDAAQGVLFDHVYRVNRSVHEDQLARRQLRDGRTFSVIADDTMFRAEGLVRFAETRWDHLDSLDVPGLTASLARYDHALEELLAYHLANTAEVNALVRGFPSIANVARGYRISAAQLASRARDRVAYTDAEKIMIGASNERAVVGTPAAMIDAYNRLVEAFGPLVP